MLLPVQPIIFCRCRLSKSVCVCVCVCARACVRACVRVCVCVLFVPSVVLTVLTLIYVRDFWRLCEFNNGSHSCAMTYRE